MDMKKILQALDSTSSKPVEGSDNMKQFLSIVTEGANPHKVTLPVQMAMQHYAEPTVAQPKTIKEVKKTAMSGMLYQYYTTAEKQLAEEADAKKEIISEQARRIADRVLNKNRVVENEEHDPAEYDHEGEMAENHFGALKHAVGELESMIHPNDNLPEWVQDKITLATDYIETVRDYMIGDKDRLHEMHRDAYQRDYDSSQTGFGRGEREDDEYVNGPDPEQFKINCNMTDPATGHPRQRTATITTVHGHEHAVRTALQHYRKQGYADVKVVN